MANSGTAARRRAITVGLIALGWTATACGGDDAESDVAIGSASDGSASGGDGLIAGDGGVSDGGVSDGAVGDGGDGSVAEDGVSDSSVSDSSVSDSSVSDSSVSDGSVSDGSVSDGSVSDGGDGTVSDGGPTDGAGGPTTCSAAADCVTLCANKSAGCVSDCLAKAGAGAQGKLAYLLACAEVECKQGQCKGQGAACMDGCLGERCMAPMLACLDDGTVGDKPCNKGLECVNVCQNLPVPWACHATCYNALSDKAQGQFDAWAACWSQAKKAGQKPDDVCFAQLAVCFAGDKAGTGKCVDVFGCIDTCKAGGKNSDACALECVGGLAPAEQEAFAKLGPCWESGDKTCKDSFMQCIQPSGGQSCPDIATCQELCAGGMESKAPGCIFDCARKGSLATAGAYFDLVQCDKLKTCPAAFAACSKPAGKATCQQTFQCVTGCINKPGATGCLLTCLSSATPAASNALVNVMVCDGDCKKSCGGADGPCKEACVQKDCGALLATCALN